MLSQPRRIIHLVILCLMSSGCSSLSYYSQAIGGHFDLLSRKQPIDELLKDETTPAVLKQKLSLALEARAFATAQIGLPDNDSYKTYADLERPFAVWNVIATPPYAVETKKWCFLIVGCLSYRGYFDKAEAQALAAQLKDQGMDVIVSGAAAYSTLGWMDDPLLNTIVVRSESSMVGIIFHELAHQVVYVDGDSAFNEAFATAVEDEGLRRWFTAQNNEAAYAEYRQKKTQQQMIFQKLQATREQLAAAYSLDISDSEKQKQKQQLFADLKQWYQAWRQTQTYDGFDDWMSKDLNNAHLALIATYQEMVPDFLSALQSVDGDMKSFYELVQTIGDSDHDERRRQLQHFRTPDRIQAQAKQ